jgi:hypothetical protein
LAIQAAKFTPPVLVTKAAITVLKPAAKTVAKGAAKVGKAVAKGAAKVGTAIGKGAAAVVDVAASVFDKSGVQQTGSALVAEDGELLFGMPKNTVYIGAGVALGGIALVLLMSKKK